MYTVAQNGENLWMVKYNDQLFALLKCKIHAENLAVHLTITNYHPFEV